MATLTTRPAVVAAAGADADDAVSSAWPASLYWSWRTPCVTLAVVLGRNVHPYASEHTQMSAVSPANYPIP